MSIRNTVKRLLGRDDLANDKAPATPPEPGSVRTLLARYMEEARPDNWGSHVVSSTPAGKALLELPREDQVETVLLALAQVAQCERNEERLKRLDGDILSSIRRDARFPLMEHLLRRKLPWTEEKIVTLLVTVLGLSRYRRWSAPMARIVGVVEKYAATAEMSDALRALVKKLAKEMTGRYEYAEERKLRERLEAVLAGEEKGSTRLVIAKRDAWTTKLVAQLDELSADARGAWDAVFLHCQNARTARPTKTYLKQATKLIEAVGQKAFAQFTLPLLDAVGTAGPVKSVRARGWEAPDRTLVDDRFTDMLRGLVWMCSLREDSRLIAAVGNAGERCFKKVPDIGPRCPKVGNACLYTLSHVGSMDAVAQLSRLKIEVKHASVRKQLEKALAAAAKQAGLSPEDLEELAAPTFGLTGVGVCEQAIGDFTARLTVTDTSSTQLVWVKPDGKTQKSVPKAVKDECADEVKQLKAAAKAIQKMLPAQRDRVERLLLNPRDWPLADWRPRYLDHPLVGSIARRLIWQFTKDEKVTLAAWCDGRLIDVEDCTVDVEGAAVTLWHPIDSDAETVLAWRNWLGRHTVTQPFKQAHREIYQVTDAERQTEVYSNRFAAHVVKQHQLQALCQQRGWSYTLMGAWDCDDTPTIILPQWQIRVEFYIEPVGEYPQDTSDMGIFLYMATDQVRFSEVNGTEPMPIEQVPLRAFTEIMRDVDLFVAVTSVGNDPNWQDGGPDGRYRDYWHDFSFGDLSATAQTRREVLEHLVPRLKIADRCRVDGKFLIVRGDVRTYKIHLGSSNILMEPNDQYLCIVPGRGDAGVGKDKVYLPFEGDRTMAVILSKAFMLVADKKITDKTIVSQIKS